MNQPNLIMAVNPDLQKERDSSNINVEELACVIHGGAENLAKRREVRKLPELSLWFLLTKNNNFMVNF